MKKLLTMIVAMTLPLVGLAQLKVNSSGKVIVGTAGSSGTLNVNQLSGSTYGLHISSNSKGQYVENRTDNAIESGYGIQGISFINASNYTIGIRGAGRNTNTNSSDTKAYGVMGEANCDGTGNAYGVYGYTSYTNGAGIFGTTYNNSSNTITGKYAGYFNGNMKVTGTIDGTLVNSSDARLKEDVQPLSENAANRGAGVLDILESLTPVSFKYKKMEEKKEASAKDDEETIEEEELPNPVMEKEHFGLIAQELQEIYPNLVYEKDNGYLAVNYVELVPVLMQAIKELNAKVESLEAAKASHAPLTEGEQETLYLPFREGAGVGSYMNQNVPNPFTEKTDIAIFLPETVQTATLYIYDLSGKQIEQHPVEGRGNTVMTIHAERMDAGMYIYSLIADKKVVTTKKMIVVK